uniref:Uncharacterized protein n=1 Tax=Lygus hesperus TaxID=30085 RepID=A0A0K8T4C7_LYGHE
MWWQGVLPTMGIIGGCLLAPQIINYFLMKLVQNGNAYRRDLTHPTDLNLYWRDIRLSGSPYVMKGLSDIPDTDEDYNRRADNIDQPRRGSGLLTDPSHHTTPCPTEEK